MSIRDKMAAKNATIAPLSASRHPTQNAEPKTGPGKFMAAMPLLAEKNEKLESARVENEKLREQLRKSGGGMDIELTHLVEIPGRRRHMPPERYLELRENLRHNPLIHPVVVRETGNDKFEIVSGHHRIDVFRELGRPSIRSVILDHSEDQANDGAFYANLMQSDLTDYEKFVGFKAHLARHPETTQAALAEKAGVIESTLSYLLSFDSLPADVLSILEKRPSLLGAKAGSLLANLTKQGKADQVTAAVQKLVSGEIDQSQAVKLAGAAEIHSKPDDPKPIVDKVKNGKTTYCEMRRAKNVVRLSFQTQEEAEEVHAAIRTLLAERVSKQKS